MSNETSEKLLTREELAQRLRVSVKTLAINKRMAQLKARGLRYVPMGRKGKGRKELYLESSLNDLIRKSAELEEPLYE